MALSGYTEFGPFHLPDEHAGWILPPVLECVEMFVYKRGVPVGRSPCYYGRVKTTHFDKLNVSELAVLHVPDVHIARRTASASVRHDRVFPPADLETVVVEGEALVHRAAAALIKVMNFSGFSVTRKKKKKRGSHTKGKETHPREQIHPSPTRVRALVVVVGAAVGIGSTSVGRGGEQVGVHGCYLRSRVRVKPDPPAVSPVPFPMANGRDCQRSAAEQDHK
ncbi:hypothetical protein C8F04DRAFT_1197794 [Mycena alexandri]|uniref:Uncharacterized protein n=1 Tax=Mycena alexandri TaxID=1745969 RepID=A0AAD6S2G0_9AGAR|nr:hypothetical protein C8F04DRAFT_1197794 [Mycena alexandri]